MDTNALAEILVNSGYLILFALLLLTGVGSPLPEDLLLAGAGYLVYVGALEWPEACLVSWYGVVGSDLILFSAGRRLAWRQTHSSERWLISEARMRRAAGWFDRFGLGLIFVARFVPGIRAMVFVTAGCRPVPAPTFLAYDAAASMIWIALMIALGWVLGSHLESLGDLGGPFSRGMTWLFAVLGTLVILRLTIGREESKL
jgi:membrane protein DedA with SNARE-associated domain